MRVHPVRGLAPLHSSTLTRVDVLGDIVSSNPRETATTTGSLQQHMYAKNVTIRSQIVKAREHHGPLPQVFSRYCLIWLPHIATAVYSRNMLAALIGVPR